MKINRKYAKLIECKLCYAPNKLIINNSQVFNADAATYKANGYLPVVNTEPPQSTEDYYYTPYYVEENEQIIQKWQENIIPVDTKLVTDGGESK